MTVTFPRASKRLITRSQDGVSMRSAIKLNLTDELHSEFVPTKVISLGHASAALSSTEGTLTAEWGTAASSAALLPKIALTPGSFPKIVP
jgi:hypothetical protein